MRLFRKNKRRTEDQSVDYWQSIADALTALLLAVLLVVAILILVIAGSSGWFDGAFKHGAGNVTVHDVDGGRWDDGRGGRDDNAGDERGKGSYDSDASKGSGGGAGDWNDPDPGKGEWDDPIRAAIHVTIVDAETGQTIAEDGVTFKLVSGGSALALRSYYPETVEYAEFATTKDGTFYLPQRIGAGTYYLRGLTAP